MKEPERPGERSKPRVKKLSTAILKAENQVEKPKSAPSRPRKQPAGPMEDLSAVLSQKVVGQPAATRVIVPYIQMFQAGLAPEGRPVGVFLLLGPTGTGKTKTIEALADVLHGSEKNVLKVDCGEFQMEHEVAKLIGAPPGYLGHRETQPMLTQQRLNAVTSEKCNLSLVLFDEIEKAAPSMTRLLLGVLDKGILRLGDNSTVNFEKSLVFLTSNLGAREMMREINPEFGFQSVRTGGERTDLTSKLQGIGLGAVRKRFSPEFVTRIECIITYQPLTAESLSTILDQHIVDLQDHVNTRLGNRSFTLDVPFETRQFLLKKGTSAEYGARELNRTIHRFLTQPLATMVATNQISPGAMVRAEMAEDGKLNLRSQEGNGTMGPAHPTVLLVDDNRDLLHFLERLMADAGWTLLTAENATEAKRLMQDNKPNAALLDYMLPDGNGVELGVEFLQSVPQMLVIVMTGTILPPEEEALCEEHDFPVLRKPFLASDVMNQIRSRLLPVTGVVRA
jgi:ATP-dependent Clp protease ATP-binding subunit ClpA